jgi:hypothetical protein
MEKSSGHTSRRSSFSSAMPGVTVKKELNFKTRNTDEVFDQNYMP